MYKCSSKIIKKGGQKSDEVRRSSSSKKRDAPSSSSSANNSDTRRESRVKRSDMRERSGSKSPTEYCKGPDMKQASMIHGNALVGKGKAPWKCPEVPPFMTARQWTTLSKDYYLGKKNQERFPTYVPVNQRQLLRIKNKGGNSNKYLMKINKIKETLKLLKKNKVKNKVKITKLNKSIEGLKKKENVKRKKTKAKKS